MRSSGAAKIMGLSIDQTISLLTIMREASGRTGREVGNALNSILSYVQRPASIKTFESFGIKMFADEARTQFRNVMEIFQDVAARWGDLSPAIQDGFVKAADDAGLFNEELAVAIGVQKEWNDLQQRDLSQAAAGVYRRNYFIGMIERLTGAQDVLNNMTDAAGYSQRENARTMDTLEKKYESLKTAAQQLSVALGDAGLLDILKGLTSGATNVASSFSKATPELKAFVTTALEIIGLSAGLKGVMGLFTSKNLLIGAGALLPGWTKLLVLIPALIGGIALYASNLDKVSMGMAEFKRQQENLVDTYNTQIEAADDSSASMLGEAKVAETLADKLEELSKIENLNVSEKAQMKSIVDQLNSTLPNLNLQIDEQTGKINGNTTAIRDNIKALREQAIVQAYQSKASAAGTAYVNQEILLGQTQNELLLAESELSELKSKYGPALKEISELRKTAKEQGLPLEGLGRAIAKINEKYGITNIEQQVSSTEGKIKGLTELVKVQTDQLNIYSSELDTYTTKAYENAPGASGGTTPSSTEELVMLYRGEEVKYVKKSEVAAYLKQGWSTTYKSKSSGAYSNPKLDSALKELEHKKALNQMSLEDEIVYLNKVKELYVKTTDERWDLEERLYNAEQELMDKRLQNSVDWINQEKEFGRLSAEEEIAAWNRVLAKQKDNAEAVKEANKGIFNAYKDLLNDQQKEIKKAYDDRIDFIDKEIDKLDEEKKALDRSEEERDYNKEVADLQKELAYWSVRTSEEARQKVAEINEKIAEKEHDREIEIQKQTIEDKKDDYEKDKENLKAAYTDIEAAFNDHSINIVAMAATTSAAAYQEWVNNYLVPLQSALQSGNLSGIQSSLSNMQGSLNNSEIYRAASSIVDLKKRYEIGGDKGAAEEAKYYYNLLEGLVPTVADMLHKSNYEQSVQYLASLPKAHSGGETLSYGAVYMKPGELIFPDTLSTDLKTLISVLRGGSSRQLQNISNDKRVINNFNAPLFNSERTMFEDETDTQIFARELVRAIKVRG